MYGWVRGGQTGFDSKRQERVSSTGLQQVGQKEQGQDQGVVMVREAVCLTVEAIAGSRTQEAAVPRSETVCPTRVWTGGSGEDILGIGGKRKEEEKGEETEERNGVGGQSDGVFNGNRRG